MSSREEKTENLVRSIMEVNGYNRPMYCQECGGLMIFKGVGEYRCEDCGSKEYDDYGKVRKYLEKHVGANAAEVSDATGVTQKSIREMLRESRLEIAPSSNTFMKCEICGAQIRSGRYCDKCESAYHKSIEEKAKAARNINLSGFGTESRAGGEGAKRFIREA